MVIWKLILKSYAQQIILLKHKQTGQGRPQTFYQLTSLGKNAFKRYVKQLQHLLDI